MMIKRVKLLDGSEVVLCQDCLDEASRPGNLTQGAIVSTTPTRRAICEHCPVPEPTENERKNT